jgi:hypothetical protein
MRAISLRTSVLLILFRVTNNIFRLVAEVGSNRSGRASRFQLLLATAGQGVVQ